MKKRLLTLLLLLAPSVLAQNPTSGGPIPQSTYTTPSMIGGGGGGIPYGLGSGTAQAQIIASPSPTIGALTNGVQVCWLPVAANSGAAPTLQVGTLTAKPITKYGTIALIANDIVTSTVACAVYDGTEFQLQMPKAGAIQTTSYQAVGSAAQVMNLYTSGSCDGISACTGQSWGFQAPASLVGSLSYTGNLTDGSANSAFVTDGSQHLSTVQLPQYIAGAGLVNAMTATYVPAFSAYAAGEEFDVLPNLANTTTNPTLNVNALGAKTVTKCGTSALVAGDYSTTAVAKFIYDGTNLQLQNPQAAGCGATATPNPATTNGFVFYDGSKLSTDVSLLYTSSVGGLSGGTGPAFGLRSGVNIYSPATTELDLGVTSAAGAIIKQENLFGTFDVTERIVVNAGTGWGVLEQHDAGASLGLAFSTSGARPISIRPNRTETARFQSGGGLVSLESAAPTNITASTAVYEDSTQHEEFAATAGSSTFGMKVRVQPGKIHQTAQTAAITTATLCAAAAGACNVAGNYTVEWAFTQVGTACGTPGAGGVTFLLTWTDQNGVAHSAIQMPMDDAASLVATTGTFHFTTSNATAWGSGNMNISSNGSILQYATGYTACGVGTGSYQIDAWVTRKE